MLLVNSCKPLSGEAISDTNKRRPDPSVDERDPALDETGCNDIPGRTNSVENGEDLMAGCVAPTACADRRPSLELTHEFRMAVADRDRDLTRSAPNRE